MDGAPFWDSFDRSDTKAAYQRGKDNRGTLGTRTTTELPELLEWPVGSCTALVEVN